MRKMVYLLLALLLAGSFSIFAGAEQPGYRVNLGYADGDWSVQEWGEHANSTFWGPGTLELSYTGSGEGISILVIEVENAGALIEDLMYLSDLQIHLDGVLISVDVAKIKTGIVPESGNFLIEIYDANGETASDPPLDVSAFRFSQQMSITVTFSERLEDPVPSDPGSEQAGAAAQDPNQNQSASGGNDFSGMLQASNQNRKVIVILIIAALMIICGLGVYVFLKDRK